MRKATLWGQRGARTARFDFWSKPWPLNSEKSQLLMKFGWGIWHLCASRLALQLLTSTAGQWASSLQFTNILI